MVRCGEGELGYHIFYQMIEGSDDSLRRELQLGPKVTENNDFLPPLSEVWVISRFTAVFFLVRLKYTLPTVSIYCYLVDLMLIYTIYMSCNDAFIGQNLNLRSTKVLFYTSFSSNVLAIRLRSTAALVSNGR